MRARGLALEAVAGQAGPLGAVQQDLAAVADPGRSLEAVAPGGLDAFGAPKLRPVDTASPEFRRWFGDSKVVDSEGRPLVVYHGTNQVFRAFDASRLGENTHAASSIVFFFSECPSEAGEYADLASRVQVCDAPAHEVRVAQLAARVRRAEQKGDWDTAERLYLELEALDLGAINAEPAGMNVIPVYLRAEEVLALDMGGSFDGHVVADAIQTAKQGGYDALKLLNVWDPVGHREESSPATTQWAVFSPNQIKSALSNTGAFDPADPDIRS